MAKAYYSTVFEQNAAEIWEIVRDFNNYPVWVGGAGESGSRTANPAMPSVRSGTCFIGSGQVRQRLLALSDVDRSQTYEFCGAPSLPHHGFQATIRITPRSSTATAPSSNGGRLSIANPAGARSYRDAARLVRDMARIAARGDCAAGGSPEARAGGTLMAAFSAFPGGSARH